MLGLRPPLRRLRITSQNHLNLKLPDRAEHLIDHLLLHVPGLDHLVHLFRQLITTHPSSGASVLFHLQLGRQAEGRAEERIHEHGTVATV